MTRDWPEIIQKKLDGIGPLPCRVDEMTSREHKIFEQLSYCVGFLQYMRDAISNGEGK